MRIIAKRTLKEFYQRHEHRNAKQPLESWYAEAKHAEWRNPTQVKEHYRSVSIIHGNRVVFNIAGNKYRLVVKIHYNTGIVFIRFIGTHADYNKINVESV